MHASRIAFGLVLGLSTALGCSSNGGGGPGDPPGDVPPADASALDDAISGSDSTVAPTDRPRTDASGADAPRVDAPRADVVGDRVSMGTCPVPPTPTGTSRAGAMCTEDTMCGSLECDTGLAGGYCSAQCDENASQACEQAQCGGGGSTCLSLGDGADATSFCAPICNPVARTGTPGSCRAGTVCTGWWYTHETGEPDRTGCEYFCASNATCPMGEVCNVRTGECGTAAVVAARRADGEPCDPTMESGDPPVNTQCRGICFVTTDVDTQGVCGSLINMGTQMECPDDPTRIRPETTSDDNGRTDNLGLCLFKECMVNADCTSPLRCVSSGMGEPSYCEYP